MHAFGQVQIQEPSNYGSMKLRPESVLFLLGNPQNKALSTGGNSPHFGLTDRVERPAFDLDA